MEPLVFLLDVDNTLLDNDAVQADLAAHLEGRFGAAFCARYWAIFESLRAELGYADYLGALQRLRLEQLDEPGLYQIAFFLLEYPFAARLYPQAGAALAHCATLGRTVILSDGDVVFQPRKVQRSGLWACVEGRVLIYLHKEQMLPQVEQHYPAAHYVAVDDKLHILTALKRHWGARVTTIFVRQGHYARAVAASAAAADLTLTHIGELSSLSPAALHVAAPSPSG
jgi:FMN phosphatase YigB (HAD superfamily)